MFHTFVLYFYCLVQVNVTTVVFITHHNYIIVIILFVFQKHSSYSFHLQIFKQMNDIIRKIKGKNIYGIDVLNN